MTKNYFKRIPLEGQDPEIEIWKDIPDFPGYQVSNMGRVRSSNKCNNNQKYKLLTTWRFNENWPNYRPLAVLYKNKKRHYRPVHRLVLHVFVGPCPDGMQCCHNDGNKTNNKLENLRWDTPHANAMDKYKHGTMPLGENNVWSKLNKQQIVEIRNRHRNGESSRKLAKELGVNKSTILRIARSETWNHIKDGSVYTKGEYGYSRSVIKRGVDHGSSKLNNDQVQEIKTKRSNGVMLKTIAKEYNISASTVSKIARGDAWKHI